VLSLLYDGEIKMCRRCKKVTQCKEINYPFISWAVG